MWLIIVGAVAVGLIIFILAKTSAMNNDPRSRELAARMLAAIAETKVSDDVGLGVVGKDSDRMRAGPQPKHITTAWKDVAKWLVSETPDRSPGQRITMMAHALSMIKNQINEKEYRDFVSLSRQWDGYTSFFG